jgi:hypothetical protein
VQQFHHSFQHTPTGDQYDVREGGTGSGGDVRNLGQPVSLAERYFREGADEISFLNITGFRDFPLEDLPMLEVFIARTLCMRLVVEDAHMRTFGTAPMSHMMVVSAASAGLEACFRGHFRAADGGRRHPLLH